MGKKRVGDGTKPVSMFLYRIGTRPKKIQHTDAGHIAAQDAAAGSNIAAETWVAFLTAAP